MPLTLFGTILVFQMQVINLFLKLTDKQIMEQLGLTSSEWNAMLYGSKNVSESYYEKAISLMEGNHV